MKNKLLNIIIADLIALILTLLFLTFKMYTSNISFNELIQLMLEKIQLSGILTYGLFCLIQEVLARGILQKYIKTKTNNTFISIGITTLIFCSLHYRYSITVIIGALIISIIAGIFKDKTNSILPGFAFHWFLGGFGYILAEI